MGAEEARVRRKHNKKPLPQLEPAMAIAVLAPYGKGGKKGRGEEAVCARWGRAGGRAPGGTVAWRRAPRGPGEIAREGRRSESKAEHNHSKHARARAPGGLGGPHQPGVLHHPLPHAPPEPRAPAAWRPSLRGRGCRRRGRGRGATAARARRAGARGAAGGRGARRGRAGRSAPHRRAAPGLGPTRLAVARARPSVSASRFATSLPAPRMSMS